MSGPETGPAGPTVRRCRESDVAAVVGLVRELAEYEKALHECHLTEEQLHSALFGGGGARGTDHGHSAPALFGHVALAEDRVVGCALWFLNFSTWRGVHGIYLEDLYVQPAHRGAGLGRALLAALAQECVAKGYARLEWSVLDWNEPSIGFYRSLGAVGMDDWTTFRLTGGPLASLGA